MLFHFACKSFVSVTFEYKIKKIKNKNLLVPLGFEPRPSEKSTSGCTSGLFKTLLPESHSKRRKVRSDSAFFKNWPYFNAGI